MVNTTAGPMVGKTILVTGGTGGIGKATAVGLAAYLLDWLTASAPARIRQNAVSCRLECRATPGGVYLRIRYRLLFTALPHLAIEHHWRRPGRDVSRNSSEHPGRAHSRSRPGSVLVSRSTASQAMVASAAGAGWDAARVIRLSTVS
jgi:hypothetical protein